MKGPQISEVDQPEGTPHIRVTPETYARLRQLAEAEGISLSDALAKAVDAWYRRQFLAACNEAYARLKADPKAWKTLQAERKAWDATLNDGFNG